MKVLRVKDKASWTSVKRGTEYIIPFVDNSGEWVISLDVLTDPAFEDLAEDILDQCDIIDFDQLTPSDDMIQEDTPIKAVKGEFKAMLETAKDVEEAVLMYYQSKIKSEIRGQ